ncbi:MAG: AbrB/MazE/SpoVT family DNA-binding domain-containing protein [Oscillospiraceae bacterium]
MKKGKYVGISKVGEKGQIVIPKEARDMFDIKPGDSLIILCDKEQGMAIVKSDIIESIGDEIFKAKQQEKE